MLEEAIDPVGMNIWDLDTIGMNNLQRVRIVVDVFRQCGLLESFRIPVDKLVNFVCCLSREYNPNPFHNFVHGFTVFHASFYTLVNSSARGILLPVDQLAMLVAAICHDVGHRYD